jgi:hypothetical protein
MANNAPQTRFVEVDNTTTTVALSTAAARVAHAGTSLATNDGTSPNGDTFVNSWDFGTVDISGTGDVDSVVKHLIWNITNDEGNTTADNFRFWTSSDSFAGLTDLQFMALACSDGDETNARIDDTYVATATPSSYTGWTVDLMDNAEPSQNIDAASATSGNGGGLSMPGTDSASTDVILLAAYWDVRDGEKTGTFEALTTNYNLRCSLKFDFS